MAPTLTEVLRGRARAASHAPRDELDAVLLDMIGAAQRACPTIALPAEVFVAYVGERMPADVPQSIALRQMHTADLYLACGCWRGDHRALAAFDDRCLRRLDGVLQRMGIGADTTSEVKQDVRRRVLVGDGGPAEIADFSGRGDLRGWVRVMAVRLALQRQRRVRRELPLEDDQLLQLVVPADPAADREKGMYREEFKRAFDAALRALSDRERTLLRQHYIDALTVDELAALYRVHRATAARMVARARLVVLEATRAAMMSELDVEAHDLDSILRMIRSQIEISLRILLRARKR